MKGSGGKSGGAGCAVLIVGALVLGLVLWGIALVVQILGVVLFLGGPVLGLMVAAYGWLQVRRAWQVKRATAKLKEIAAEAYQDLVKLNVDLDYLELTKGIGSDLAQKHRDDVAALRGEVESVQALLAAAQSPENIKEALIRAERLRLRVRVRRQQS